MVTVNTLFNLRYSGAIKETTLHLFPDIALLYLHSIRLNSKQQVTVYVVIYIKFLLFILITNFHSSDFPADGFGQFRDEFNDSWILIWSSNMLNMILQDFNQFI